MSDRAVVGANPYVSVGSESAVELAKAALERARRLMSAQQAISGYIAEFGPPDELLPQALRAASEALGWSVGAAWLTEPGARSLRCTSVWHGPSPALADFAATTLGRRLERGEGLPGHVLATAEAAWIEHLGDDPRMPSTLSAELSGLCGAAAFPLVLGQNVAGVIEFFTEEPREPDLELLAWFSSCGAQLAQYLDRWAAHETLLSRDQALAAALNGVVIGDATQSGFPVVYANPSFERITGWSPEEIHGRSCGVLQGQGSDRYAVQEMSEALRDGREHHSTILNYRKDGTPFWNEITLSPVVDAHGRVTQYVGIQNDVTERRRAEEQVAFLAYHDSLTGLANRALLEKAVERAVERGRANRHAIAVLFLDLDNFKDVNDTAGHAAGDTLLRLVADRLRAVVRVTDVLARQGGDEFLVLLPDIEGDPRPQAARVAEDISLALARPFPVDGLELRVGSSIGISSCPQDAGDAETLLRHADAAMYRAKRTGGASFAFATAEPGADPIAEHPLTG